VTNAKRGQEGPWNGSDEYNFHTESRMRKEVKGTRKGVEQAAPRRVAFE